MDTAEGLDRDPGRLKKARNLRRIGLALLAALLVAGLAGAFDPRERDVSAAGAGIDLEARYPETIRGGIDSPLELRVSRAGGFRSPIRVAISREWLDLFDPPGIEPEPSEATGGDELLIWSFEPPPGELLEVSLQLSARPALRGGESGRVAILGPGESELASAPLETTVIP